MGYYSDVMISTTKKDYNKIVNVLSKLPDKYLIENIDAEEYKENNIECVCFRWDYIKYYKEFEDIQALEKSLSKAKDGYVFCRLGEENVDIEFRKRSKLPELMKEFDFIREINNSLNKELEEEEEEEFE